MSKMLDKQQSLVELPEGLLALLKQSDSVKAISTLNEDGSPYVVFNPYLTTFDDKTLLLGEELERSQSNRNLVRSIWFDKPVSVLVSNKGDAYTLRCRTYRCLIVGSVFSKMLAWVREKDGPDADIVSAWELIVEECYDTSAKKLRREQRQLHPYFDFHLDIQTRKNLREG